MTIDVTGRARTERGQRYLKQLTSHLGEKLEVTLEDGRGVVRYEEVVATLTVTPSTLEYAISGEEPDHVYRTMGIVVGHLERFGAKDGLECGWDDAVVEAEYRTRREAFIAQRRAEVEKEHAGDVNPSP
ncbi:DUF2218 domain-containing protein [Demequina sp. NBRC 110056]|uniref:DUF2218 domain-containing protein n=1 Tax=Demequina sp. NBRC 110056 TaxID=1570345 RepID=UPI0009FC6A5E|nr:DUF2218 domain-containing protein [Demequina sp. NBRC 110056]